VLWDVGRSLSSASDCDRSGEVNLGSSGINEVTEDVARW
jgi:hypothetical protein